MRPPSPNSPQRRTRRAGSLPSPESLVAFASFSDPAEHLLTYPNGDQVHAFALCFHLRLTSDVEPRCGDGEVSEFRWVWPGALPEPIHLPTRRVLAMYQEYTSTGSFQAMCARRPIPDRHGDALFVGSSVEGF
ncbi:MAG TPA: hypothetical protein VES02_03575 [Dermatophilaceae bacterium]|nr:hypothetical protein [Dermatophilaceae bacterium]